jgi:Xaa-Pro aminopeptidase
MGIFSAVEMKRRLDGVLAGLGERRLDALFLHSSDNVYYTTGAPLLSPWGRPMWAVVVGDGAACVVGAELEKENMERNSPAAEVRTYGDESDVGQACLGLAADFVRERCHRPRRIGVERSLLPVGLLEGLQAALPGAEFIEAGDLVADLRLVKSAEELTLLKAGADLARLGAGAFLEALSDNTTELAVAAFAVGEMDRALGALFPEGATSAYAYCHFGEHTLTPHHHPTGRRLRRGDVVALNVFPVIWGYCMELERTFVFGTPTAEEGRALSAVNEAFEAAKAQVAPGASMAELDRLTRGILNSRGLGDFIRHGTGHAHGIMIGAAGREAPGELRVYNQRKLAPGMVTSVEPGVYIPGLGGFRHSDVLLVTGEGATCLTDFPTDLSAP